ncbi:Histone deacetylase interacting [Penicillium bovifimosum]|uniref:Histone deacetylase interacting n=1 Tax=Penicillium bovifimosum TaxID=126998 RepID=A0A9W9KXM9_9EURO|nr:Histone deacetylase interacting [Penicillium bovifimosum]KAJ5124885.1 Histone deacetylase interacting [Penicillium bovifimosum]
MNPGNDNWHSSGGPPSHPGMDQMNQPPRPLGSFRYERSSMVENDLIPETNRTSLRFNSQNPAQQGQASQPSGPVLPPPSGPYHPSQSGGHSLPGLAELSQTHGGPHQPSAYGQHPAGPSHNSGHSLPGIGRAMQHASPQLNRERERDSREREIIERQRQEEMAHRERERERDHREQIERQLDRRDPQHHPVQSHTGSIPLHQPVANKVPNSIHGPGGLLSTLGGNPQNSHQGGPQSAAGLFGPQMQHGEGTPRSYMQHPGGPPGQPMMGYNAAGQQIPGNVAALAQGQQPILNDALSYLDQVKVRFVDQPDVYNRFLDIMKDFKSQAIDTPGVIQRVSTLFNGHPALIQGFNTFLPPGYRIECGTEDNPDAIRVTTPSGTNTLSMPRAGRPFETITNPPPSSDPHGRSDLYRDQSRAGWQQGQQQDQQQGPAPGSYSPGSRMMGMYPQDGPGPAQDHHYGYPTQQEQQAASAMTHQQDHRGVAQLQGAASAASAGLARSSLMGVSGAGPNASLTQPMNNLAGVGTGMLQGAQDLNKRGPVEFNHAISYVNKIKNRFSSAPEIYKQFLEILQTYQRESKPIQDVYGQVTQLFNTAPDLLEDFKQFLPESAAHAKQVAAQRQAEEQAPLSNLRSEPPGFISQTPNRDVKMPPLGQFNVKDSKESKKRRGGAGGVGSSISGPAGADAARFAEVNRGAGQFGNASKRAKYNNGKPSVDMANVSPTLIPALPEPLPPLVSMTPSQEEIAFFDRVKKFIANKQVFSEFLKTCNLYTTDLVTRSVLVSRAEGFIGSNAELMNWFKRFMNVEEPEDKTIDPKANPESGIVNLAHCRSLGPSYRLLPKRERQKPCSGRDHLCNSVLNDDWASHPTWASEDSGFVAHRKNQYEDALHRIEEDRHDYDHYIESCARTIQLIEPICQQFLSMTDEERAKFELPEGLGGQSVAIYQRTIKKIYDRQRGQKVIREMFADPCLVLPVVLYRCKQKLEEWKSCQREWDKVWREQMQRAYWRSLDHQAIATKQSEKKLFATKNIQQEIQSRFEVSESARKSGWNPPSYQAEFFFSDIDVLLDCVYLLIVYFDRNTNGFGADPQRLINFIRDFIPAFFGLDRQTFNMFVDEVYLLITDEDNYDDVPAGSRKLNTQKLDLLREALVTGTAAEKPAFEDVDMDNHNETPVVRAHSHISESEDTFDVAELRWMEHPGKGNFNVEQEYTLNEKYKKKEHHMYSNLNIFCFLRTFEILYSRLVSIKEQEQSAHEQVRRGQMPKAAHDLCLIDRFPTDFFYDIGPDANLYKQVVRMCEEVIKGDIDQIQLEETLRRFYMQTGYLLYHLDRIFSSISKFVASIFTGDARDRSSDIINLFFKEREKETTTHDQELQYRKQVERLVKEGDVYRITFFPANHRVTIQILTNEDATLDTNALTPEERWSYYVNAYSMRDPTEGVEFGRMRMPFLKRNLPPKLDEEEEYDRYYSTLQHHDGLTIRICANNYTLLYQPDTHDWFWRSSAPVVDKDADADAVKAQAEQAKKEAAALREKRHDRFSEKWVNNPAWARGLSKDEVDEANQRFRSWVAGSGGVDGPTAASEGASAPAGQDVEMAE